MNLDKFEHIYFLGIGGIGMSALARYFNLSSKKVSGYDRTPSSLTSKLQTEGIEVHFNDKDSSVADELPDKKSVLIVLTPAVPKNMGERIFFEENGYTILKRAQLLGAITRDLRTLAVAGTHGKTTTSAMLAHVLTQSEEKCNAFLGGISTNYDNNLIVERSSNLAVVEADEFDRSFLHLHPFASILTSTDADHLDIYNNAQSLLDAFQDYVNILPSDGCLVLQKDISLESKAEKILYGVNTNQSEVGFRGNNLRVEKGLFLMDVTMPEGEWKSVELGIPGIHNAENALGVIALCRFIGLEEEVIRKGLASFLGVKRRFEYHIRKPELVYIDDYAHHPTAINSLIASVRLLYPDLPITAVFQPHLFSRTADFMDGFAASLDLADKVYLLPIYPAREEPMEGITSEALMERMKLEHKEVVSASDLLKKFHDVNRGVILTVGAGDIDRIVEPLKNVLT